MNAMLTPVLALIGWSLVMWVWMYATRLPAMSKAGISPQDARFPGSLDKLPDGTRQAADNYNHLMEQPTIFYALVFYLYLAGRADDLNVKLAWAYVVLRVVHSLVQATVNRVTVRFAVFSLGTLTLAAMVVREVLTLLAAR
ncbi:hypothetical protein C5708_13855 [Caulobacter sp. CCUG 60055]|uniref:MAPEG family protein n=1 Tax=Caulobacter sp. CCUG 60055 TaxID=2100090 RepID=UPI001FA6C0F1|nr:MAPEG family protein [Caulobacter sp. CCUG 60055]MBQ1541157.1 MAPEG family protein [Caulobacteraceae bacterium]MCI3181337.1 hypothetical protein [Caulobacter sp. CCUG 60055]